MALITFTGLPASGKTTRSRELYDYLAPRLSEIEKPSVSESGEVKKGALNGRKLSVKLISEHDFNDLDREIYRDTRSEKPARGAVFSAVQRELNKNTIVICDAPNYIKGFRYQLYCVARELGALNLTMWTLINPAQAKEFNEKRDPSQSYTSQTFDELAFRYEEPNGATRWDSPLLSVLPDDKTLPYDRIMDILTTQTQKPANIGVITLPATAVNYLQVLEATTTTVSQAIQSTSAENAGIGGKVVVSLPKDLLPLSSKDFSDPQRPTIELPPKQIMPAQMNRYRRQFVGLHRNEKAIDAKSVAGLYLKFVETTLNGGN